MTAAILIAVVVLVVGAVVGIVLLGHGRQSGPAAPAAPAPPTSGWEYVFLGALASAAGGGLLTVDDVPSIVGFALLWFGGVLATAGVVAIGVTVGAARSEWRRQTQ